MTKKIYIKRTKKKKKIICEDLVQYVCDAGFIRFRLYKINKKYEGKDSSVIFIYKVHVTSMLTYWVMATNDKDVTILTFGQNRTDQTGDCG